MNEVVAYCRVACAKESDPSAEAQLQEQMVRRYADARGLIICETYLDAGVSGGTLERPALQSLLADCRAGKIGRVITQDPERLSRDPLSLIAVLERFLEDGVNVEFSTEEGKARFEFIKAVWQTMDEIGVRRRFGAARGA
jgi:site-specific DNA recombinase